ncbi:MAG TPA: O-methyltransferase, partial [Cyclobacteriaceae bacterium]|nr:O-methyltransferase [Cyclobacteriaceae bacterium]
VPYLSTKERLHLQKFLPCATDIGGSLIRALGYKIDSDRSIAVAQMRQYGDFYLQYPYFIKAFP